MLSYDDLKNTLVNYAYEQKIPMTGEFEITSHCDFSYGRIYAKTNESILTKEEWFELFDMAKASGMLYASLTGEGIFLHPDFIEIYNYLYDLGVKITLFVNRFKLSQDTLNTLKKRPPEMVVITIYGYNESSYKLCTQTDAFKEVDLAIDLLIKQKINLRLRTIPLPIIYQVLNKFIIYAKTKKLTLNSFLPSTKTENQPRLTKRELLNFETRLKQAFPNKTMESLNYKCGAFKNSYFINHKGYMQACSMMPKLTRKVGNHLLETFIELQKTWEEILSTSPCRNCELN